LKESRADISPASRAAYLRAILIIEPHEPRPHLHLQPQAPLH